MTVPATLDHLLWAVPDLADGVAHLAGLTGVEAVRGGSHPGLGTANHLLALDLPGTTGPRRTYLEVIGPDPEQGLPADRVGLGVGHVREPSLHTWAVRPADLDETVRDAAAAGIDVGEVRATERTTPDGRLLRWRMTPGSAGIRPFLIDWRDTPHPAQGELPALTLLELSAEAPDAPAATRMLAALGAPLTVTAGPRALLRAVLDTPRGRVVLATA
ncbi:VOC family protein [Georgenia satyanarayanai]|uniref:VOC family protein n=1 Tax=Georgenia satyanarayanai TaxID=860221 RepID=UPI001264435D|nr:VOC family protein [Georgenia satyanarayanai]